MNGLALCAGTGGLDLGMQIAEPRYRTVGYVEREASAAASLVARMADATLDQAPVWDNLATFDGPPWRGCVDIVTSGDPCQPNSNAGKRQGADDDRFLIDQVLRVVEEVRPAVVFRENVPGNADGQLAALVPPLEAMGFRVAGGIFSAAEVGASHRRERLFILAYRAGGGCGERRDAPRPGRGGHADGGQSAVADPEGQRRGEVGQGRDVGIPGTGQPGAELADTQSGDGWGELETQGPRRGRPGPSGSGEDLAHTGRAGLPDAEQSGQSGQAERGIKPGATASELRGACLPLFAPGPSDFDGWREVLSLDPRLEPAVRRTADGLAHRNDRLRLCGNGVSPLAAAYAYRTLWALLATGDRAAGLILKGAA